MLIKYSDLSKVAERINIVAKEDSKQVNMMMTVKTDENGANFLEFAFCTGRVNLFQRIPVSDVATEDVHDDNGVLIVAKDVKDDDSTCSERMVINENKFQEIVSMFKPTESIVVSDVYVHPTVKDGQVVENSILFECEKSMEILVGENETASQKIASLKQEIRWDSPESSMKVKIYTRYSAESVAISDEEVYDTWKVGYLRDLLGKIKADKGRQTLISAARKVGFVYNPTNSILVALPDEMDIKNTVVLDSSSCDQIYAMLGKMGTSSDSELYIVTDEENHSCKINSDDKSVCMSLTTPEVNVTYVKALNRYQGMDVNDVQCTMYRSAFKDIITAVDRISNKGKSEAAVEATITCSPDTDAEEYEVVRNGESIMAERFSGQLVIEGVKSASGSNSNKFVVALPGIRVGEGELGVEVREPREFKIRLFFNTLLKVLSNFKSDIIALDVKYIDESKDSMVIRFAEVDTKAKVAVDEEMRKQIREDNGLENDAPVDLIKFVDNETQMGVRSKTLGVTSFIQAKMS